MENPTVIETAKKYNKTPAQLLIRMQVQRGIVVIPKSVTPSRIEQNFDVFDFEITADDMSALMKLDCNGRLVVPRIDGRFRDKDHPHFPFNIEF